MADRIISDGPAQDTLTFRELAVYLKVSERQLRQLLRLPGFPRGYPIGRKSRRWTWQQAWAARVLLASGFIEIPADSENEPAKRSKN